MRSLVDSFSLDRLFRVPSLLRQEMQSKFADVAVAAREAYEAVAATGQEAEKPAKAKWPMKCIWAAAAFVTVMSGYGMTPWDTIRSIAAARGVDDDTQTLMWRAAIRFHSLLRCIRLHQQLGCALVHNRAGIGNGSGHARRQLVPEVRRPCAWIQSIAADVNRRVTARTPDS